MNSPTIKPDVNFYILPDSDLDKRLHFVFRLVEKAFAQKLPTLIIASDSEQLESLDRLIWTAKPERFIPHDRLGDASEKKCALIMLTDNINKLKPEQTKPQVVIDLSYDAVPLYFAKIMLVANQHLDILPNARSKYQAYIDQGIQPNLHKI